MKRLYKYYPEDFAQLPIHIQHMDLIFDVHDTHTEVTSTITATALKELKTLSLDAKNLEVHAVTSKHELTFTYDKDNNKLHITFTTPIPQGTELALTTKTTCKPTDHILEGLYYDATPKGAPPTQITQCQQWGFQRIAPCLDDMTAKCTYTTTITADSQYTHMITNGDVSTPRHTIAKGRDSITYSNTKTPMAPYLFFLGVGTYTAHTREFEYPDGKTFTIELLTLPDADKIAAQRAVDILHDAILWVYLFTGREAYSDLEKKQELYNLIHEREQLRQQKKDLTEIRRKITTLSEGLVLGYKYTGDTYREIGMQHSDVGGMENVGNTTITMNRIMPFNDMTDGPFEYMIAVKVHEYYHNINGSEVTGTDPFQLWLNEAVTVHIERQYTSFLFGEAYSRIGDVQSLLSPGGGTFAQDDGPASMPIQPEGFNDPNELITAITYVKAPEVVRMVETLIGKEAFAEGLALYHSRFKHSNATSKDWISAMEEVSGTSLQRFMHQWLTKLHYPKVSMTTEHQDSTLIIHLEQTNATEEDCWEFPLAVALCDTHGTVLAEKIEHIQHKEQDIIFENVQRPAYISANRDYSFYGKLVNDAPEEELFLQARTDANPVGRYLAIYTLFDREKQRLLLERGSTPRQEIVELFYELLADKELMDRTGPQILALFEGVENESLTYDFKELYRIRRLIHATIAKRYTPELLALYEAYSKAPTTGVYIHDAITAIKYRDMKNAALGILSHLDTQEVHLLIKKQYETATAATDKLAAFRLYINSSAQDKQEIITRHWKQAKESPVSWETFLYVMGSSDSEDALELIKLIETSPDFHKEQPNDQRGLYGSFITNRKQSLQTRLGQEYTQHILTTLTPLNEYTTVGLMKVLGVAEKMSNEYQVAIVQILLTILSSTTEQKTPSVYNTAKRMLLNMPLAVRAYEDSTGKRLEL